jgi:hypothetical protein
MAILSLAELYRMTGSVRDQILQEYHVGQAIHADIPDFRGVKWFAPLLSYKEREDVPVVVVGTEPVGTLMYWQSAPTHDETGLCGFALLPTTDAKTTRGALVHISTGKYLIGTTERHTEIRVYVDELQLLSHIPLVGVAAQIIHLFSLQMLGMPRDLQRVELIRKAS